MSADVARSEDTSAAPHLPFRADVQGLRALAVVVVIFDHLRLPGFRGGYVGVDVFFVISGFLITGLLLRDVQKHGRVSLADFYARRARRILPAATVVGVATLVAAAVFLPLLRVQTIITDFIWSTLFAANIRFAMVGTDYFAQGQPASPLRHYWSLAVEEQFYLVWPLVVLLWALWRRRRGSTPPLGLVLGLLIVASLVWSVWATEQSPTTAYFSTFTRAWELGLGAAAALALSRARVRPTRRAGLGLGVVGLAMILAAVVLFDADTAFPGVAALLPVLGAVALLVAGSHAGEPTAVGRVLSSRPAVTIGDWSYSLYLWHWPLITIARQHFGIKQLGVAHVLVLLVATFVLSWLTFRFVETPFREGRRWRRPRASLAIYPATLVTALVVAAACTLWVNARLGAFGDEPAISTEEYAGQIKLADDDYIALVQASVAAAREGRPVPSDLTPGLVGLRQQVAPLGDCDYRTGTTALCPMGDPEADRAIVVLGDSHARAWSPTFDEIGRRGGYQVYTLVYSGCMANAQQQLERGTDHVWDACETFKSWAREAIAEIDPEVVIMSTSATTMVDPESGTAIGRHNEDRDRYYALLREGFAEQMRELKPLADRVYLVTNTPRLPRETGVCLSQGRPDLGDCAFAPSRFADRASKTSIRAAEDAGIGIVNARRWFCADGLCPAVVGSFVTMRDKEHITPDYAVWLADPMAKALDLPLS